MGDNEVSTPGAIEIDLSKHETVNNEGQIVIDIPSHYINKSLEFVSIKIPVDSEKLSESTGIF